MNVRNVKLNAVGTVDMEIEHPKFGWIPFTASPDDPEQYGRELHELAITGQLGDVYPNTAEIQAHEFGRAKSQKLDDIKREALSRISTAVPGITDIDTLQLIKEMYLSVLPAARNPTTKFQTAIDVYAAAKAAITEVNAMTDIASVEAYDVATGPTWP